MNPKKYGKIVIDRSTNKQYFFKIISVNGKILCHSETYKRKDSCHNAIKSIEKMFRKWMLTGQYDVEETAMAKSRHSKVWGFATK